MRAWVLQREKYAALNCTFPTGCLDNPKKSFWRKCDESDICKFKFSKLTGHKKFNKLRQKGTFFFMKSESCLLNVSNHGLTLGRSEIWVCYRASSLSWETPSKA